MATANDLINCAQKYIGIEETYNNNVIFNTRYYGHSVNGSQYSWCCVFIYCLFEDCNASELFYDGKKTALCQTLADWFKAKGQWYTTPQVGDCVFFKYGSSVRYTDHIGIVEKIYADGSIGTIEGNTSDKNNRNGGMVMRRTRKSGIVGYGRPKYSTSAPFSPVKPYMFKGVDVSACQRNVDYSKLKESGVEFAIIKIIRKNLNPDEMFEKHYTGFTSVGVPVFAVYNYSYATTVEKARIDAQAVIRTLSGRKIPVCFDAEDNVQKGLGSLLVDMINAYQEVIEKAGLPFILYTGPAFYNQYIKPWERNLKCKDIWMARYYKGNTIMPFNMDPDQSKKPLDGIVGWQYTSHGNVNGYNGNIDLDIIYRDISSPMPAADKRIVARVKTMGSRLNVRKKPNNGTVVDKLNNGAVVNILDLDYTSGWYRLGKDRYVSPNYIDGAVGVVTTGALNIRNADSTKGQIVGRFLKGDTTPIVKQSQTGWYLTPKGWVSNNYVKLL